MSIKKIIFLKFLIITLSSVLIVSFLVYAWDSPSSTPPNLNAPPPINTGDEPQSKAGDLNIGGGLKYWITKAGDSFALKNDAGEVKFIIGQDGNVGIGTVTPSQALQITRTGTDKSAFLDIEGTGDVNAAGINLRDLDNSKLWQIVNRANEDNKLNIYRHNGTSWLKVMSMTMDGNVGIGPADPKSNLFIYNPNDSCSVQLEGNSSKHQYINLMTLGNRQELGKPGNKGWHITARGQNYSAVDQRNNLLVSFWNGSRWHNRVTLEPDGDIIFEIGN